MKITGTRSYILVELDDRLVKIGGELTATPTFYASVKTITNWEPPFEQSIVTEDEKKEIAKRVIENNNPAFKIIFEE